MIGIDAKIESLRLLFETYLFTDISNNTYVSYGRAFILKREDKGVVKDVPELQISSTNKYQEVLPNRKINGHSFFVVEDFREPVGNSLSTYKSTVNIYFTVNLDKLYPSVTERAVEYLHRDVDNLIKFSSEFHVENITTGLDAFSEFGFVKETDNLEPFYLVRFKTNIEHNLKC